MEAIQHETMGSVPDRGPALIVLMWTLVSLSFIAVVFRFASRATKRLMGWDDFFMATTWLCFVGWSVVLTLYANRGGCQHAWDVAKGGVDNVVQVILLNWIAQMLGIVGIATGKISVASLLLSIMRDTGWTWQRVYLWTVAIFLTSGVMISCSLFMFLQCSPPKRLWDLRVQGSCVDADVLAGYGTFTGAFYTFIDVSLAIIPMTIFWHLRIVLNQKIQLCIVFGLNILTSICSGIKTKYLSELGDRVDQTWGTFDIFTCVTVEFFLLIVCGTVPTLYPLLRWIQSLLSSIKSKVTRRHSSGENPLRGPSES